MSIGQLILTLGTKNMRSSEVGARDRISIRGIVLMAGSLKMSGTKNMRSSEVGATVWIAYWKDYG